MKRNPITSTAIVLIVLFLTFSLLPAAAKGNRETPEPLPSKTRPMNPASDKNPLIEGETEITLTVFDSDGNAVVLSKRPDRVVVNYTSMVGIWYMAGGVAIGRPDTKSGEIPEAAKNIETTGHVANPNAEKIVSLKPDLVILSGSMDSHRKLKTILDQNGTENVLLEYVNYGDFINLLDLFSRLIGKPDSVESMATRIEKQVDDVVSRYRDNEKPKFLSLFASTKDFSSELGGAHTAYMAELIGGVNIASAGNISMGQTRVTLNMERIIQRDPDIILVTVMGDESIVREKMLADLESNQAWTGVRAVREKKVFFLPGDFFLRKPNERFPEAFEYLGGILYGR